MQVTSAIFLGLTILVLLVYYLLPRRPQNIWLLLVSYAFCVTWAWHFALVLLVVTIVNFFLAKRVHRDGKGHRSALWLAIGFNVLTLAFFRLGDFFAPELEALLQTLGLASELGVLQILLPIGLSFYIVENISYQVDVYRGQLKPGDDFIDYALYQAYFPKLLAGPIERAGNFLPLLAKQRIVDNEQLTKSLTLIVVGAVRKIIIADILTGMIPWDVFEAPSNFTGLDLWGWLIVYGFALYNDFAGYTSLVRGISGLFGIELSANFHQPYFSRNFGEFWNNWHTTLSHWLRDYIYFPTLRSLLRRYRNRANALNVIAPPMLTMLVSGLWHGFSINMLVWGGLHGLYQVGGRVLALKHPAGAPDLQPRWRQLASMGVVFVLTMWAWVPFRLELPLALEFWQQLLQFEFFEVRYRRIVVAAGYILISLFLDIAQRKGDETGVFLGWPRLVRAFLLAVVIFLLIILSAGTVATPFVYQGF